MKPRDWLARLLCFVLGVVVASGVVFAVSSCGQDNVWPEIAGMKRRINALEQYNENREKAEREAARLAEENRNRT